MKKEYIKPSILLVETKAEALLNAASKTLPNDYSGSGRDLGLETEIGTFGDDEETTTSNAPRRSIWD